MKKQVIISFVLLFTLYFCPFDAMAQTPISMAAVSGAVTAQQPLGRFEVFVGVYGNKGGVYHTWQSPNQAGWEPTWVQYYPTPDENPHGLVAARDGIGRIAVAWISNGEVHFAEAAHANTSLLSSDDLTVKPTPDPYDHNPKTYKFNYLLVDVNSHGMIEVLALNKRGRVFSIKQKSLTDDGKPWIGGSLGAPSLVGGGFLQNISVTKLNGGFALVGLGKNGNVYFKTQTVPETWDANNDNWTNMGGDSIHIEQVRAQESTASQLEVIALSANKQIYLQFQNVGNHTLSGWRLLLDGAANGLYFGPAIFFDRFKDGTLFLASHLGVDNNSQYAGSFLKSFQLPNNGDWPDKVFAYVATTGSDASGFNTDDGLGYLSPDAFTLVADANGNINYFAAYHGEPQVEHYIDTFGASPQSRLVFESQENSMPDLPW
jgi:hypothetical protein